MTRPIRVAATGDIVLTKTAAECRDDPRVDALAAVLADNDVVLASVELPFSDLGSPSDRILNFRARPELVEELSRFSVDLVTVANNHSSDYGWVALEDSVARMRRHGIAVIGAGSDRSEAEREHVVEVEGRTIAFIGYSCLMPLGSAAGADRPGISTIHIETAWEVNGEFQLEEPGVPPRIHTRPRSEDRARALERVRDLAARHDFVVVTLHWGYGFGLARAEYQRRLGHDLVDAGAAAVLGHHVHCPQGVEVYRNAPIVYSPGNFVAQQPRDGATAEILAIYDAFSPNAFVSLLQFGPDSRVTVKLVAVRTNSDGLPAQATDRQQAELLEDLRYDSRVHLDTELELDTATSLVVVRARP